MHKSSPTFKFFILKFFGYITVGIGIANMIENYSPTIRFNFPVLMGLLMLAIGALFLSMEESDNAA